MWSPSQAAALRAAKRRPTLYPKINLVGFLSIQLALLSLFFADLTPDHQQAPVDLPYVQTAILQPSALREDAIRVAVTRDGRIFFRRIEVAPKELPNLIKTALREGAEREVYLVADQRAKYVSVEVVLHEIQLAGTESVVILTENPQRPKI